MHMPAQQAVIQVDCQRFQADRAVLASDTNLRADPLQHRLVAGLQRIAEQRGKLFQVGLRQLQLTRQLLAGAHLLHRKPAGQVQALAPQPQIIQAQAVSTEIKHRRSAQSHLHAGCGQLRALGLQIDLDILKAQALKLGIDRDLHLQAPQRLQTRLLAQQLKTQLDRHLGLRGQAAGFKLQITQLVMLATAQVAPVDAGVTQLHALHHKGHAGFGCARLGLLGLARRLCPAAFPIALALRVALQVQLQTIKQQGVDLKTIAEQGHQAHFQAQLAHLRQRLLAETRWVADAHPAGLDAQPGEHRKFEFAINLNLVTGFLGQRADDLILVIVRIDQARQHHQGKQQQPAQHQQRNQQTFQKLSHHSLRLFFG